MYRIALITNDGTSIGQNFLTKEEAEDFILNIMEEKGVKYYRIIDKETGKIVDKNKEV